MSFLGGHVAHQHLVRLLGLAAIVGVLGACSADCAWQATGEAWLDANGNGESDPGENPLANVVFHIDDRRNNYQDVGEYAVSDSQGKADLYVWMPGCPKVELEVYAEPPANYQPTTVDRIKVDLGEEDAHLRYGFKYRPGAPIPTPIPFVPIACWTFELGTQDLSFGDPVIDIAAAPDGTIWATAPGSGVFRLDPVNGNVTAYTEKDGIPGPVVRAIAVDLDGTVWIGSNRGVARLVASEWVSHTVSHEVRIDEVEDIAVAPDGTLWFVGWGGVSTFEPQSGTWRYDVFGQDKLSSDWKIGGIEAGPDGSLWFVSYYDLYQLRPTAKPGETNEWVVHKNGPDDPLGGVGGLHLSPQSTLVNQALWMIAVSDQGPALVRYDPVTGSVVTYNHATTGGAMFGGVLTSLASGRDGSLWIGMESTGVLHFIPDGPDARSGIWIHYTAENGLPDDHISSIAVDSRGIVWLGTDRLRLLRCLVE
jgi:streptogramin lyase